jgi:hypothetical protein
MSREQKNSLRITRALSFLARFLGLMGKQKWPLGYDALWFPRCGSVHTFFTFLRPDILFVDSNGMILSIHTQALPWRVWWGPPGTFGCLEIGPGEVVKRDWRIGTKIEGLFDNSLDRLSR